MVNQMVYEGTTQDNPTLDNVYLGRSACEFGQCSVHAATDRLSERLCVSGSARY